MKTINESNSGLLRAGLLANALFSISCAIVILANAKPLAQTLFTADSIWFGRPAVEFLTNLGIGLGIFALLVFFRAFQAKKSRRGVRAIIIGDFMWVGISVLMLTAGPHYLTEIGYSTVLFVALAVFCVAIIQHFGLKLLYQGISEVRLEKQGDIINLRATREISTEADTAWAVINNHEAYADVADNLSKVSVVSGEGQGMIRECTNTQGDSWSERAHVWEDGRRYGFQVDTKRTDYPYPLESMAGIWAVEDLANGKCRVSMDFKIHPMSSVKGRVFGVMMSSMFRSGCDRLLGRWEEKMTMQR